MEFKSEEMVDEMSENLNRTLSETGFRISVDGKTFQDNSDHSIEVTEVCPPGLVNITLNDGLTICSKYLKCLYC